MLLIGQSKTTGGTNGLSDFDGFFGYDLTDPANKEMIYYICAFCVLAMVLISYWIRHSFMGELVIGVRDQENRMKFLGYNPASIKVFVFSLAAMFAGLGGAMFVPVVGIISPSDIGVTPSILMLAGVVIGGRPTAVGTRNRHIDRAFCGNATVRGLSKCLDLYRRSDVHSRHRLRADGLGTVQGRMAMDQRQTGIDGAEHQGGHDD